MINSPPLLSPHEPPPVTIVPQMESTAGLPHGLEAGPVIWGSGNNHHFPTTFSSHEPPCGLHPARHLHSYHSISPIVYCPSLYQTIKGKRLSPPHKWQKWKKEDRQGFSDQLQNARMINHSNTQVSGPVQFEKHCLSTKIHYVKSLSEQLWREYVIHLSVQHFWKTVKQNKPTL